MKLALPLVIVVVVLLLVLGQALFVVNEWEQSSSRPLVGDSPSQHREVAQREPPMCPEHQTEMTRYTAGQLKW